MSTPPAPPKPTSAPWRRPKRLGYSETLRGLGGVVAPLLTGFSLATIALLLTSGIKPRLADWAAVAFTGTVGFLLLSMQVAFLALARSPSPADILTWQPEVTVSAKALHAARARQAADFADMSRLWRLCGSAYDFGILSFLSGVLLLLIPHHWAAAQIAAVALAGLALTGELWWTLANLIRRLPHPVVRDSDPADFKDRIAPLDAVGTAAVLKAGTSQPPSSAEQPTPRPTAPETPASRTTTPSQEPSPPTEDDEDTEAGKPGREWLARAWTAMLTTPWLEAVAVAGVLVLLAGLGWGIVELVSWGTSVGVRLLHALGIVLFGLAVTGLLVGGVAPAIPGKRRSWFLAALGSAILGALCTSGASIAQDQITKRLAGTDCFGVEVEVAQLASAFGQPAAVKTLEHDSRRGGCAAHLKALINEEPKASPAKVECVALLAQMDELLDDEPKSVAENAARNDPRAASCEVPIEQLARR